MPERIPASVTIRVPLQAYLIGTTTPATGKTIAITISKNGGAYGNPSGGATNATEVGSGSYYVDLSTTDTGTSGPLFVLGTSATIDNVVAIYNVVNAHNAGFDGIPNAVAGANGGLPTGDASGRVVIQPLGLDPVLIESGIGASVALTNDSGAQLTSINARQALALSISPLAGLLAGAGTTNVTIKPGGNASGNTRVDATVDANGNRTASNIKVPT